MRVNTYFVRNWDYLRVIYKMSVSLFGILSRVVAKSKQLHKIYLWNAFYFH